MRRNEMSKPDENQRRFFWGGGGTRGGRGLEGVNFSKRRAATPLPA